MMRSGWLLLALALLLLVLMAILSWPVQAAPALAYRNPTATWYTPVPTATARPPVVDLFGQAMIVDMFGQQMGVDRVNLLEERIDGLLEPCTWPWAFDVMLRRNGPHYKRLWNEEAQIACDLFLTTDRGWGGTMAIRTGPADFSQALVTLALRRRMHVADGCLLHGHPKDDGCTKGELCPLIVPTLTEEAFFQALGLKGMDPRNRTAEAIWRDERRRVTA